MKIKVKWILAGLTVGLFAYLLYTIYDFGEMLESLGPCVTYNGPCNPYHISIDLDSLEIEQFISIPNGKFGFANLSDTFPPKMIRIDHNNELVWAIEFGNNPECDLPHSTFSTMSLSEHGHGFQLKFFNQSMSEPGVIYLDAQYEVKYMCLSPF